MMMSLLPLMMVVVFFVFFLFWKMFRGILWSTYTRYVIVGFLVTLYSLHPTITRMSASLFFCMTLDNGQQWLQEDLQIQCWTSDHLRWSLSIGLPSLVIWVIGLPTLGFFYLYCHRHNLEDPVLFGRFRMIY